MRSLLYFALNNLLTYTPIVSRLVPPVAHACVSWVSIGVELGFTASADVHIVIFGQCKVLLQVALTSLKVPVESLRREKVLVSHHFIMFVKLHHRIIKVENGADSFASDDALFKVTVLLAIKVLRALGRHFICHVGGKVPQVEHKVTWA